MSTQHKFIYKHDEACYLGERYPQQEIIIQSTCDDLDAHEILQLFKSYMMACGYAEKSFYDACETAADENNPYRKGGNRHELGKTQWREEISPTYEDTLKNNINKVKERDDFRDMLA
jgi:ABC-type Zn uptake system ZnuABC Zn-binding protein ZnuA